MSFPGVLFSRLQKKCRAQEYFFPGCKTKSSRGVAVFQSVQNKSSREVLPVQVVKNKLSRGVFFFWLLSIELSLGRFPHSPVLQKNFPRSFSCRRITQKNSSSQLSAGSLTLSVACTSKTDPGILFEFFRSSFWSSSGFRNYF